MILSFNPKGVRLFAAILFATIFLGLQSFTCSKNDDVVPITTGTPSGTWRVSLYWDSGDETSKFNGYTFTFMNGGQVTATNGTNTIAGSWSETSTRMSLDFGNDPLFKKISDDYLKLTKNSSTILLKDDNPLKDERVQFSSN